MTASYPYVWLDASYVKARQGNPGQVVSLAVVIASEAGVNAESGQREVLGLDVGRTRTEHSGSLSCAHWWPAVSRG